MDLQVDPGFVFGVLFWIATILLALWWIVGRGRR